MQTLHTIFLKMKHTTLLSWMLISTIVLAMPGCSEDDISDKINIGGDDSRDKRNVVIKYNAYIKDKVINRDSIYSNIFGEGFTIDEVQFLVTNFRYISENEQDTIWMDVENHAFVNMDEKSTKIGKLPQGSYNGNVYFDIGVNDSLNRVFEGDSLLALIGIGGEYPEFLEGNKLWNNDTIGILMCRIRGEVYDTLSGHPDTTTPFSMLIGGEHFIEMKTEANFSINVASEIIYILDWDLDEIFNIYPLLDFLEMGSTKDFPALFDRSQDVRDTLSRSYFLR